MIFFDFSMKNQTMMNTTNNESVKVTYYDNGRVRSKFCDSPFSDKPSIEHYYDLDGSPIKTMHWEEMGMPWRQGTKPTTIHFYDNGEVREKLTECNCPCVLHIDPKKSKNPARVEYYKNGNKKLEEWYTQGFLDRKEAPARIEYYENGNEKLKEWYTQGDFKQRIMCE